jgi:hypothetical protein
MEETYGPRPESKPAEPAPAPKTAVIVEKVKKRKIAKPTELRSEKRERSPGHKANLIKVRIRQILYDRGLALKGMSPEVRREVRQNYNNGELTRLRSELKELGVSERSPLGPYDRPNQRKAAEEITADQVAAALRKMNRKPRDTKHVDIAPLENFMGHDAQPVETLTARQALERVTPDLLAPGVSEKAFYKFLMDKLVEAVGDTKIHVVTEADLLAAGHKPGKNGRLWGGLYRPLHGDILINEEILADPATFAHTIVHEVVHAATVARLSHGGGVVSVRALMDELLANHGNKYMFEVTDGLNTDQVNEQYGFDNEYEFIAEAMSNPEFQAFLARTPISEDLAKQLNMKEWKAATLWNAFVEIVRKALHLPPGSTSALEAAISITERLAHRHLPAEQKQYADRVAKHRRGESLDKYGITQDDADQWANELQELLDRQEFQSPIPTMREAATWAQNELTDAKSAFDGWASRAWVKFLTFDQMRQQFADGLFGSSLKKLTDAIANQQPTIQEFTKEYSALAQEFIDYTRDNVKEARDFARIALGVRAIDGHVVEGETPATINQHKLNEHQGKKARRGWQAHARLPDLQREYNVMSPEGRALFQKMAKFYSDLHNRLATDTVAALLNTPGAVASQLNPATIKGIIQRTLDQQLTDSDKAVLGDAAFHALEKEASFHKVKGMYFPEMRYGDHVVETEDKITNTMGGTLEGNDTVLFKGKTVKAAEKLAELFVRTSNIKHLSTKTRYFNALTGEEIDADIATGLNDVEYGVSVHMQTKGVYMFDSPKRAAAFARTFEEDNPTSTVIGRDEAAGKSGVQDRLGSGYQAHIMTGTQMSTLMSSVEQRLPGKENEAQVTLIRSILSQAAGRMLSGNRIAHRRLKSKHVSGASEDFARNVFNYGQVAARHIATVKAAPRIREALNEMRKILTNYQGKDKDELVRIRNEVHARVEGGVVEPNEASQWMKDALAISYFVRLGSISYSINNATQVITVTAPLLNSKFGAVRGSTALGAAYGDIGFGENVIAGAINTVRAAAGWKRATLSVADTITETRDRLSKLADGPDLVKMINTLIEGNAISLDVGFELGSAIASGRGRIGTGIAKLDRILRQLPQAVETINRTASAVAAYRLARTLPGYDHDKATQYAFDVVKTTQGDYSNANAPRFFNNSYLRPALQFRKYAQLITYVLLDSAHRAYASDTREERTIAAKQLGHTMATQIAIAGAFGLPGVELLKLAFMVPAALGMTGSWDDQEDWLREILDDSVGKYWGELVTSGVITRAVGVDMSTSLSMSDVWTFGSPEQYNVQGMLAWMFKQYIGSPGTYGAEFFDGLEDIYAGKTLRGAGKMFPLKAVSNIFKATRGAASGEMSPKSVALKAIGINSSQNAERSREIGKSIRASQREKAASIALGDEYRGAPSMGERMRVRAKILKFNREVSTFRNQVSWRTIDKLRGKDYRKHGD